MLLKFRRVLSILLIAVLIIISGVSILHTFKLAASTWNTSRKGINAVTEWGQRLSRIKEDLPKNGVVGYVSERDIPGIDYNPIDQDEEFAMTQYFLAPLVLEEGTNHPFVIGNFGGDESRYDFERDLGIQLVRSYGLGIFLFHGRLK